jgi:phenylpropionate dioxygenase-like ring-hydroxylating dioxygenase large terminal subunit
MTKTDRADANGSAGKREDAGRPAGNGLAGIVDRDEHGNLFAVRHGVYYDEEIYRRELDNVFGKLWVFVGLEQEVPEAGDFKTTCVGEIPVVVVRDEGGALHVFENVCLHRGAKLVRSACGKAKEMTCLYHHWSYGLDGRLLGVGLPKGYPDSFRKEDYRLSELPRVETFAGMIFASYDPDIMSLKDYLNDFQPYLTEILNDGAIEFLGHQRYHVKANWKLFVENTIDAYHPGLLHLPILRDGAGYQYKPGLGFNYKFPNGHGLLQWPALVNDPDDWDPELDLPLSLCKSRQPGDWDYVSNIFPNALVLQIEDILTIRQLIPRGVDKVDVITYNLALKGESEELQRHRAWTVTSQFGIAGVASLDDKIVMEAVQEAAQTRYTDTVLLRGDLSQSKGDLTDEVSLRGFYEMWTSCVV